MDEIEELKRKIIAHRMELDRAYRCIYAFNNARAKGELLGDIAYNYHSLTIGAANRWKVESSMEGTSYFIGKPPEVLAAALRLTSKRAAPE